MRKLRQISGFTFVEIVITVVIAGVISALAVPSFLRTMDRVKLKSQVREVISDIRWARSKAIQTKVQCGVVFDTLANTYKIFLDTDNPGGFAYTGSDSTLQTKTLGSKLDFGACTFTNGCIIFRTDGTGSSSGLINCNSTRITDNFNVDVLATTGRVKII